MKQDECLFDNTLLLKKNFPAKCEDHFSHSDVHLHLHVSNIYLQICQEAVRETIIIIIILIIIIIIIIVVANCRCKVQQ